MAVRRTIARAAHAKFVDERRWARPSSTTAERRRASLPSSQAPRQSPRRSRDDAPVMARFRPITVLVLTGSTPSLEWLSFRPTGPRWSGPITSSCVQEHLTRSMAQPDSIDVDVASRDRRTHQSRSSSKTRHLDPRAGGLRLHSSILELPAVRRAQSRVPAWHAGPKTPPHLPIPRVRAAPVFFAVRLSRECRARPEARGSRPV